MRQRIYLAIFALGFILVALAILFRRLGLSGTGFKVRESDRNRGRSSGVDALGNAKQARKADPLQLSGFRFDGEPHEILGIAPNATKQEIQDAYHERIKRFHPDKIGKPGSREWNDAQQIAARINEARKTLLARKN
jgi:DnaJ-domain-containing protein 1